MVPVHAPQRGAHVLDVETLDVYWGAEGVDHEAMRVSCAVVHDVASARDLAFACQPLAGTERLESLFHFLEACRSEGCTLVGHGIRGFDWPILAWEFQARGLVKDARAWHPAAARLVDTMEALHAKLGWRPSLEALARHNLGEGKLMAGALAPGLWREGRHEEVVGYCRKDVALTLRIWQKGRAEGRLKVEELEDGTPHDVEVAW